jgi:hypothetical protein
MKNLQYIFYVKIWIRMFETPDPGFFLLQNRQGSQYQMLYGCIIRQQS